MILKIQKLQLQPPSQNAVSAVSVRVSEANYQFAKRVRMHRLMRGWSQEVLAELSGLHRNHIGGIENVKHDIGLSTVEKIAHAFEIPINELFRD
jgi:DNA-binding XRE family transcriptional regulator